MTVDLYGMRRRPARRGTRCEIRGCPVLSHRFTVGDDVIDVNRHVDNLAYLRWMKDVATAHSTAQGWTFDRYIAAAAGWFVRSHSIEYLARPSSATR